MELSTKLSKNSVKAIINEIKEIKPSTSSPYFSPRRTRNKKREDIKNENCLVDIKKPKVVFVVDDVKNEESLDDIEKKNLKDVIKKVEKTESVNMPSSKRKLYTSNNELANKNVLVSKKEKIKTISITEPQKWHEMLDNIREMRLQKTAPVDTMGCSECADSISDEKTKRFQILVALMLSSQTKDQTTYATMNLLKENILTPENIAKMNIDKLEKLLYPTSFYKTKAKNIRETSKILIDKYNSDIPNTFDDLVKLPGVGPKMAHICMNCAWNIVTGIGVDVHVHRISNRLGWVSNTVSTEQTRRELESWLPSKYWSEVNHLLVGFGQTICTSLKPNCTDCKNQNICPSAFKTEKKKIAIKKSE